MADTEDTNVTDQDSLSADELKLLGEMEKDEGAPEETLAPVAPKPKPAKKVAPAAAAPAPKAGAEGGEGESVEGAEGEAVEGNSKTVPLAALHEARNQTKALRDELAAQRAENAKVMDRFEKFVGALAPKPEEPKPEPVPDFDTDPAGWIAHQMQSQGKSLDAVQTELKTLKDEKAANAETAKQHGAIREIVDYAVTAEKQFMAKTPDYQDASNYLLASRREELGDLGYDQNQVEQIINNERLAIAQQCKANGKNPAEVVYGIAKRRGYVLADEGEGEEEVAAAAPAPKAAAKPAADRLEAARQGQDHSTSLTGLRGNAPSPLTVQRLLEMSEAEFAKAVLTPEGRALMGS